MRAAWFLLLSLAACGGPSASAPSPAGGEAPAHAAGARRDIDVAAFVEDHARGVPLIDVRTPGEYAAGHVPGAVNVPLDQLRPDHPVLTELGTEDEIYVICAVGGRSSHASDMLSRAGYHVVNIERGTDGWAAIGQPLDR